MKKIRTRVKIQNWKGASIIGFLVSITAQIIMLLVAAVLIYNRNIRIEHLPIVGIIVHYISVFSGTLTGCMISDNSYFKICASIISGIYIISIIITILIFDGVSSDIFAGCFAGIIGAATTMTLKLGANPRHKKGKRNKRNR